MLYRKERKKLTSWLLASVVNLEENGYKYILYLREEGAFKREWLIFNEELVVCDKSM